MKNDVCEVLVLSSKVGNMTVVSEIWDDTSVIDGENDAILLSDKV